jgi:hypothetical protein
MSMYKPYRDLSSVAARNRKHAATLRTGDTVTYTALFMRSTCQTDHATGRRRGVILGPADKDTESGFTAEPLTAQTWLIEVAWSDGRTERINPFNVCRVRSVPFAES